MRAPVADKYSALDIAHSNGAAILANEGRHGRPDHYHTVGDATRTPKYTCEPHEYLAVVPYSAVAELVEADKEYDAARKCLDGAQAWGWDASGKERERVRLAEERRAAALARFGVTP